jgi:hypothetical protein
MHLHLNRPVKRAGAKGEALCAGVIINYLFSQYKNVADTHEFVNKYVIDTILFADMMSL